MSDKRYTLRKAGDGTWCVIDMLTELPAVAKDRTLICMGADEARDAVELLNLIERWKIDQPAGQRELDERALHSPVWRDVRASG